MTEGPEKRVERSANLLIFALILRWIAFCLVFFGVPVFLSSYFIRQYGGQLDAAARRDAEEKVEEIIFQLGRWKDPCLFFSEYLKQSSKLVFSSANPKIAAIRVGKQMQQTFPGLFNLLWVDSKGNPFPMQNVESLPKRVVTKVTEGIIDFWHGPQRTLFHRHWPIIQSFLGTNLKARTFDTDQVLTAQIRDENKFVFVSKPTRQGLLIARLNKVPDWDLLGIKNRVIHFNRKSGKTQICIFDLENGVLPSGRNSIKTEDISITDLAKMEAATSE